MLLSEIDEERIEWLWPNRLGKGFLTILEGDPGVGKGFLTIDFAARVTRGWPFPGEPGDHPDPAKRPQVREPASVILVTSEDSRARTEVPRAKAAGADLSKIIVLSGLENLGHDLIHVAQSLVTVMEANIAGHKKIGLIVLDPIEEALPGLTDYNAQNARRGLNVLIRFAQKHSCALIGVRHLMKGPAAAPLYRGRGSIALTAASRIVVLLALNPNDPEERVLAHVKNNLSQPAPSLAFGLVPSIESTEPMVRWAGRTYISAADLGFQSAGSPSAVGRAETFLLDALSAGPLPLSTLAEQAAAYAISERTLWRAKTRLRITTSPAQSDGTRVWLWHLPEATQRQHQEGSEAGTPVETLSQSPVDFLRMLLSEGPLPAEKIMETAAAAGFHGPQIWDVKSRLGILIDIQNRWSLPAQEVSQ